MVGNMANKGAGPGKVYLVGAGPGDPGLITVRGKYLLERAEVVIYDHLVSRKLLKHVPADAEFIYAGKKGGVRHAYPQEEINRMLVERGLSGRRVVRLKGGDPFIFGRGAEEVEELFKAGIPFEVVPGVTSATAAATYAGVPITHRKYTSSVAFITGHEDPTKNTSNIAWDKLATGAGTIVVYMGIKNLPFIAQTLIKHGRAPETPVAVVRWASTPEQQSVVGNLANIADIVKASDIKPPALVIIGEVVSLRKTVDWFENRPLFGKRVLITRTRNQAGELVARLEEAGASCLEFATIVLEPPESFAALDRELTRLGQYQWLVFTSINAVKFFFRRLFDLGMDVRTLKGPKIAVVGKTTAQELLSYGIKADLVPEKFTAEGLIETLLAKGVENSKVLIPRALKAREILPDSLRAAGAEVVVAPVYRNVRPDSQRDALRRVFVEKKVDIVTFTSSSTVTNFLAMLDAGSAAELNSMMDGVLVAAIGPITAATAQKNGLTVHVQPEIFTIPEMVNSIIASNALKNEKAPA